MEEFLGDMGEKRGHGYKDENYSKTCVRLCRGNQHIRSKTDGNTRIEYPGGKCLNGDWEGFEGF